VLVAAAFCAANQPEVLTTNNTTKTIAEIVFPDFISYSLLFLLRQRRLPKRHRAVSYQGTTSEFTEKVVSDLCFERARLQPCRTSPSFLSFRFPDIFSMPLQSRRKPSKIHWAFSLCALWIETRARNGVTGSTVEKRVHGTASLVSERPQDEEARR
jgi:hypothetical protein